jgi:hypothetical protein
VLRALTHLDVDDDAVDVAIESDPDRRSAFLARAEKVQPASSPRRAYPGLARGGVTRS